MGYFATFECISYSVDMQEIALLAITYYNCVTKLGALCLLFVFYFSPFVSQHSVAFFSEFTCFLQNCLGGNLRTFSGDIPSCIA